MTTPVADPGHLLPLEEWRQVKREARAIAAAQKLKTARGRDNRLRGLAVLPRAASPAFPSITGFVQAKYDGGARPGAPTFGVWHDAETPLAAGYALAIANYFTRCTNQTSAHFMLGPEAGYQLLDTSRVGWHCGNGNPRSIGVENCGYVSFAPDQWLSPAAGLPQLQRGADLIREIAAVHGIQPRWMTDPAEILACHRGDHVGGWITHNQASQIIGGSSHTDPMPTYPLQQLMALATGTVQEDPIMAAFNSTDDALIKAAGGSVIEAIAQHTRLIERDEDKTYGLAAIRNAIDAVGKQVAAADANDAPNLLVAAILKALPAPSTGGLTEADVETAIRKVLGGLDNTAA